MLGVLTHWALSHVVGDIGLQSIPHKKLLDALVGGRGARVATYRAVVQRADDLGAQGRVLADPRALLLADEALVELVTLVVRAVDRELSQTILCVSVRGV